MKRFVMKPWMLGLLCLFPAASAWAAPAGADLPGDIEIPYQKFVLTNGLTLIVQEDHKAPIVAVNVWYHVGSKNEKPGRTGFAHLFEHLMFNGSEHFNDDYFQAMERIGATDLNGTTNPDRTNYFEDAPRTALDLILWMESDRMGHLLGAIDQAKLDEQRGVVQNEKRQGENQPYGLADEIITHSTYPAGHPYSWTTIGSMADLNAASLDDVRDWFKTYYGAANAVVVVAGDVDAESARQKVEHYFGDIPPGPPISRPETWVAPLPNSRREQLQDRVPQARLYKVWNIPPYESADADRLNLVSDLLASGKTSRLYRRLVFEDQIATSVSAYVDLREIGSQFYIVATARPGESLAKIESVIDEELARFRKEGPSNDELKRVKVQYLASFIRGVQRIGGFGGTSDILARNQVLAGSPDHYKVMLKRTRDATAEEIRNAARTWLGDNFFALEVHPFPNYVAASNGAERSHLPEVGTPPEARFPEIQTATLPNGIKVYLAERHSVPVVQVDLVVNAGYAADQSSAQGTASLAMNMLDEGTKTRTSLEISDQLDQLGAELSTGSTLDTSTVSLSALKANLDPSLDIFADVILNPAFKEDDFVRLQRQQLDRIQREKSQPLQMALRVLPKLLYGPGHPYSLPFTGSGTAASVADLKPRDMARFHDTWFHANNAALVVVGDTSLQEILPKLKSRFGDWKTGDVPQKNLAAVIPPDKDVIYLLDRPGSIQSVIFAAHIAPPEANEHEAAIELMNTILGGSFTSRLNMNLREDKHWSYGAHSLLVGARGPRPFLAYAPVQSDKTKESLSEMSKELRAIVAANPPTEDELDKVQKNRTLELAGQWETLEAVADSINEIVRFGFPLDYFQTLARRIHQVDLAETRAAADQVLRPTHFVWVIVGDRAKIESGIRDLNIGEIRHIDADGAVQD